MSRRLIFTMFLITTVGTVCPKGFVDFAGVKDKIKKHAANVSGLLTSGRSKASKAIKTLITFASRDEYGRTPLHYCFYNKEDIKFYVSIGVDINAKDYYRGETPLHLVQYNLDGVENLIEAGADITVKDDRGISPLEFWIANGRTDILDVVSKKYNLVVKVTIKNKTFDLPLQEAMEVAAVKDSLKIDGKDIVADISDKLSSDLILKVNKLPNTKIVEFLERLTEDQLQVFLLSVNNLESVKLVLIANYYLAKEQLLNGKNSLQMVNDFSLLKSAYDNNFENFAGESKEVAAFLVGHKYAMGTEFDIESNATVKARYDKLSQVEKNRIKMMLNKMGAK
jgi:ankyrin repeat protein